MFGHEILIVVSNVVGGNPTYNDGITLALQCSSSGDAPNVLDMTGVNVTQDFADGLTYGLATYSKLPQAYQKASTSVTFRNTVPSAVAMFMAGWRKVYRMYDQ